MINFKVKMKLLQENVAAFFRGGVYISAQCTDMDEIPFGGISEILSGTILCI